jgi:hypothetical protein
MQRGASADQASQFFCGIAGVKPAGTGTARARPTLHRRLQRLSASQAASSSSSCSRSDLMSDSSSAFVAHVSTAAFSPSKGSGFASAPSGAGATFF